MSTQTDVKRILLGLPGVTQDAGSFHFRVDGKQFAWVYPERTDPKRRGCRIPRCCLAQARSEAPPSRDRLSAALDFMG